MVAQAFGLNWYEFPGAESLLEIPINHLYGALCNSQQLTQPPLALSVPLSRFTSRVGGGSAFFIRHPMFSVSKPLFWLFMALILCFMLVMHWFSVRDGIPQIKAAVLREAASLSRSEDSLRSLDLGRITRTRYEVRDSDSAITGYFQFEGSYSNQSWDVFVYWRKADTNAPIDKIEIGSTYQELRTIWSRK